MVEKLDRIERDEAPPAEPFLEGSRKRSRHRAVNLILLEQILLQRRHLVESPGAGIGIRDDDREFSALAIHAVAKPRKTIVPGELVRSMAGVCLIDDRVDESPEPIGPPAGDDDRPMFRLSLRREHEDEPLDTVVPTRKNRQ